MELLKKQEEIIEKKQLPQHKAENFKPSKVEKKFDGNQKDRKSLKDNLKAVDTDELEAIRKSKLVFFLMSLVFHSRITCKTIIKILIHPYFFLVPKYHRLLLGYCLCEFFSR